MPNVSGTENGWSRDPSNNRLDFYYRGTRVGSVSATAFTRVPALAVTGGLSVTGAISAGTSIAATTTITAGTGLTVTTGNAIVTAGDTRTTLGNTRLGAVSAFATTEPTSAIVMKVGTNPVGAITTSGGIFVTTGGADISKIIAAGTVSAIGA